MSTRVHRVTVVVALGIGGSGLTGACEDSGPEDSSATHFLEDCDASCAAGLTCLCGICTTTCSGSDECARILVGATCATTTSNDRSCPPSTPDKACDVLCITDDDCVGLPTAHRCTSHRCRADHAAGAGTGGADASLGAGGRGTGGAGGGGGKGTSGGTGGVLDSSVATVTGGSSGSAGASGAVDSGAPDPATDASATPDAGSAVNCTYTMTLNPTCTADSRCVGLPQEVNISATNVPVHVGSCNVPTLGQLPTDVTSGVLIDAPTIFGTWTPPPLANSFCVVSTSSTDWVGYPSYTNPRGSTTGLITVTNGHVSIELSAQNQPAGGLFGCSPLTSNPTWGCVVQTLTCNGTAFVPEFAH